ncbi:hypothetical protein [Pelagibacterium halotolerans]|uniref:Uncharacterized protein n=1 Tax=Pelagibacterium halotolerans (strain DSM 22347 / JCM 15775 / CGMCC 1.7692 / B2) TaxID=1082931 RepID=G4RDY8_PELHB|nr:hypothetical protein [Pelagibacterium halotolerans]AEQ50782.1 hypothetical protein KKY_743 [Pelagibacterium halotolerans B2]QJR19301.1 hypothetical protein HKM20_13145 [Pelagibacterium halotolerans]SDZ95725.1 hypothetical protein SAMN05428936_101669 [Pelagibacterium halotolerans]
MARRPTDEMVRISARVPRGQDGFWQIILKLDACGNWGVPDVEARTNVERGTVKDFVLRLVKGGVARHVGERQAKSRRNVWVQLYRLNARPAETPRFDRAGNRLPEPTIQTLWRTMKMVKIFSVAELADLASTADRRVSTTTAGRYVTHLHRAGIIVSDSKPGVAATYRLVRDLGARAPIILKTLSLYDPNAQEIVGQAEAREVQP